MAAKSCPERDAAVAELARETAYSRAAVARCVSLLGPDLGRAFVGAAARAGADERLLLEGLRGYLLLREGVRKKGPADGKAAADTTEA